MFLFLLLSYLRPNTPSCGLCHTYWVVDFRVISVFLPHLLIVLLLSLSLLLVQSLQVFSSVVVFRHFVLLKLLVSLFVKVLQIIRGLDGGEMGEKNGVFDAPQKQTSLLSVFFPSALRIF